MKNDTISIIGDGGWGTSLALVLARKGLHPTVWGPFPEYLTEMSSTRENKKFLSGITIPEAISFNPDLNDVILNSDVVVLAIPTAHLRSVLERIEGKSIAEKMVISCTKGIENTTLSMPSTIIKEYFPAISLAVLSGPSHAEEVANNIPTCVVTSSTDRDIAKRAQDLFMEDRFRVYTVADLIGVELGGSLKNVIAIAAGICDGLEFGSNTKAALLSRGLQEIVRLGCVMGAQSETFFGLSGLGDLVTTCISPYGRNRSVGERIARGEKIKDIIHSMEMVAEGVNTTRSAFDLAKKHSVEMPIAQEVFQVLFEDKDPRQSINDLMMRDSKKEM